MDFLFSCNICVIIDAATCCVEGYLVECKRNLKIFCKKLSIEEVEYNLESFKNWRILFSSIILREIISKIAVKKKILGEQQVERKVRLSEIPSCSIYKVIFTSVRMRWRNRQNRKRPSFPSSPQLVKPEIWTVTVDSYFLARKVLTVDQDHEAEGSNGPVEGQRKKHFGAILVESLTDPRRTIPEKCLVPRLSSITPPIRW